MAKKKTKKEGKEIRFRSKPFLKTTFDLSFKLKKKIELHRMGDWIEKDGMEKDCLYIPLLGPIGSSSPESWAFKEMRSLSRAFALNRIRLALLGCFLFFSFISVHLCFSLVLFFPVIDSFVLLLHVDCVRFLLCSVLFSLMLLHCYSLKKDNWG